MRIYLTDENIAAPSNTTPLVLNRCSSVSQLSFTQSGERELARLLVDLHSQFPGRGDDHSIRSLSGTELRGGRTAVVDDVNHGKDKCCCLAGASLGTCHDILATTDDGKSPLLNWGWFFVTAPGDVPLELVSEIQF